MSIFYTNFLSKSDFSFALLLVSFEPLEIQQSNIPLLKALKCGNNAVGAQGCSCTSTFCQAPLKIAFLLHKMANGPYSLSETVSFEKQLVSHTYNKNENFLFCNTHFYFKAGTILYLGFFFCISIREVYFLLSSFYLI